ncbi:DNA invertase [Francisella halioticida]|uniref:recombinase family protein n=1 Tax=Francisella halioticida TaxID=549298 RepID=UPI001AFC98A7|nr:recombinase family protein [Francisella halioticida]BCD92276.1 DNA invertase [Francisella halioticida]
MGELVGYARVSSLGQSLDLQIEKLKKAGCNRIFSEKISGTIQNRPELTKCLEYIRQKDTLIITKLDRIARSALHLGQIVDKIKSNNINFIVIDQDINTNSPQGQLMFHMLSAFAEFENNLRKERQKEGIQKAILDGKKFGRPSKITATTVKDVKEAISKKITISRIKNYYSISQVTYYRIKNGQYDHLI